MGMFQLAQSVAYQFITTVREATGWLYDQTATTVRAG